MTIAQFAGLTFGLAGGAVFLEFVLAIIGFVVVTRTERTGALAPGIGALLFGWFISGLMWLGVIIALIAWIVTACTGGFN